MDLLYSPSQPEVSSHVPERGMDPSTTVAAHKA